MNQDYIKPDNWSIIEEGFDAAKVEASESLFSIGNGAMGQRANFEEDYSGKTFQGSYIAGVYYPDKTRVGWWKNGYPEYFAKVLNAPNFIGISVSINGENLDLDKVKSLSNFRRELNMKDGYYQRSFEATLQNGITISVKSIRILSLNMNALGAIKYSVTVINNDAEIIFSPYLDAAITNQDTNWNDKFWDTLSISEENNAAFIRSKTLKTDFNICTFMQSKVFIDEEEQNINHSTENSDAKISFNYSVKVNKGETASIEKYAGYTVSLYHKNDELLSAAKQVLKTSTALGFSAIKLQQQKDWAAIWDMADITIEGDVKAQQGIRFNIFQLNQTYLGVDSRLNIGPKGFTGEKYGGSTYWDTEAYCLPFYMATKNKEVARNLLVYRYNHLQKAIENAEKLGFKNGAALYPMVTMNGEESHNEWEITFEEIHRNGAMSYAIFDYVRFTGDYSYVPEKGLEVLIAIARFWHQRATFSADKNKFMILGVTGPNEYENNINNNFYTNYIAKWCIEYALENIKKIEAEFNSDYVRILNKTKLSTNETEKWKAVADGMYFPFSEEKDIYLQQDGFLDKELVTVADLDKSQRPINQKWSWDRILRSPYIKQADVLQGLYFFEEKFTLEQHKKHFDFYEPFTVHESSLSPCVHSILAAKLGRMEQAYEFYLRTSRLDLDDYNNEVHEGCHITSMAGTWLSIVQGFGGMRIENDELSFNPQIPKQWKSYSFKINFRGNIVKAFVSHDGHKFSIQSDNQIELKIKNKTVTVKPNEEVTV